MTSKQLINVAVAGALAVFGARAAFSFLGGGNASSLRGMAAEIGGAAVGIFVASKFV